MKHNCSLWKPSSLRLSLLMLGAGAAFLLAPDAADAAITAGEMGLNIADNAKGVAKGITMAGFATGIGMGLCGGIEMFKAAKERNDGSYKSGMVKVLINIIRTIEQPSQASDQTFPPGKAILFLSLQQPFSGLCDREVLIWQPSL